MSRVASTLSALALLLLAAPAALAQQAAESSAGPWLRVRVADAKGAETVNVNLPIAVVSLALQLGDVQAEVDDELAARQLTLADLRRTWADLRGAGDADLVVTKSAKEAVTVRLESGNVVVHVRDAGSGDVQTTATLPGRVVDALLAGEGERLDVGQALRSLAQSGAGDILTATDGAEETVRIWID